MWAREVEPTLSASSCFLTVSRLVVYLLRPLCHTVDPWKPSRLSPRQGPSMLGVCSFLLAFTPTVCLKNGHYSAYPIE
jgi:hypothetical protein